MVISYGANGDVGYSMTDNDYRRFAKDAVTLKGVKDYLYPIKGLNLKYKRQYWLHIVGLWETYDISNNRN